VRITRIAAIRLISAGIILVIFLAFINSTARGQVLLNARVGFHDQFQLGSWTPVRVEVKNRGREINGIIEIEVGERRPFSVEKNVMLYRQAVWIPSFSDQIYTFYVLLNQFRYPLVVRFRSPQREEEIKVPLEPFVTKEGLFLILGQIPSVLASRVLLPGAIPVAVERQDLPEKWKGYDGVRAVMMVDRFSGQLNDAQIKALQDWIYTGGILILSLGINYHQLVNERWQKFLPLKVKGRRVLNSLSVLERRYGRFPARWGPLVAIEGTIDNGEELITEEDFPLLLQVKRGEGKIICLNFDYTMALIENWGGRYSFWQDLLTLIPSAKEKEVLRPEKNIAISLVRVQPEFFPPRTKISFFMLSYLILFAGWRYSLRWRGKNKLFIWWTILPLLVIVFTLLGYFSAGEKAQGKNVILSGVFLIQGSGRGEMAQVESQISLLSPYPRKVDLLIGEREAIIYPPLFFIQDKMDFYYEENITGMNIKNVYLNLRNPFSFQMIFLTPFRLKAAIQRREDTMQLKILNFTFFSLKDMVLFSGGRYFHLGNLNPGEEINRKLSMQEGKQLYLPPLTEIISATPKGIFNEQEMQQLVWAWMERRYYQDFQRKTYLTGWCQLSSWPLSVKGALVNRRIYTLFQVPLEETE